MTVYLDIILIYNFLIDWLLLWSTAYILKLKPKVYRLVLGACLGASYTMVLFFPVMSGFYTFLSKLLLSMCMILTVFGFHRLYVFFQRWLVFYLVAFVLGGGLLAIHFFLQSESEVISGIVVTQSSGVGTPITWGFIALCFPLVWWLSGRGIKQMRESNRKAVYYGDVEVMIDGAAIRCKGLIDTGNQLYEPITRIPVTIIDLICFQDHLPSPLFESIKQREDLSSSSSFMQLEDVWLQRIRMIPFRSVSRGMDLLLAIRPDSIRIETTEGYYETSRVLIGLNPTSLSSDGSYQAIIHPALVTDEHGKHNQNSLPQEAMSI
ncbi:sigma-E processing peptidase SpoIIGA [Ammoniphilus oxalaticus]|uniref:Sigma-E processing peptidase SpoIIGA n=1 Tax=Ammoniphilus oxalaticus TaxID=66863 RepID=A0A419SL93_9BACL|nr:sigma-E processing peptidase SpoIIGA [Ammoniphilus oxalaticus]RKD24678.1 sigma-E processing peptidase SpoIIGA [Ammoniphilus oxalaticus]